MLSSQKPGEKKLIAKAEMSTEAIDLLGLSLKNFQERKYRSIRELKNRI